MIEMKRTRTFSVEKRIKPAMAKIMEQPDSRDVEQSL